MRIEYILTIPDSSLHLGTKILSQFSGIGYFGSLSLNLSPPMFYCQRLFTITARCGDILGPCFSSSAKSLESWCRKESVGACDSVEILPFTNQIYFIWGISDSKQLSNLSTKMVLVWDADTIIWNFIIIRCIYISIALLGISPGNSILHNTLAISPGASTSLRSYSFSWRFFIR